MKCFYHNDMDGRCAASIVYQYEYGRNADAKDKSNYFEVDYSKPIPDVVGKDELVYIVDYSFTEPTLNQLQNILSKTSNVIWCDHHTSTFKLIEQHPELKSIKGIRADDISGAALTYMFLFNTVFENCPEYIKLVSDYDCWKFKFGDITTYFKLGLESHNFDALDDVWKSLFNDGIKHNYSGNILNSIISQGTAIKSYIDVENKYYLNHFGFESRILNYPCYVVNRKTNSWIFGDKIKKYPVCVTYVFDGENYTYTLYSENKDVDVSKIAEHFGGGGHSGAAGFVIDKLIFPTKELVELEKALSKENISLYNSDGSIKNKNEVIEEISKLF